MAPEPLDALLAFGTAAQGDDAGSSVVYKLLGRGQDDETYELVLEAADGRSAAYMAKFALRDVVDAVEADAGVVLPGKLLLGLLRERFDAELVAAAVDEGGLQLSAAASYKGYGMTLRLPPAAARAPLLADARRAAWVAQDLLFTQQERLRALQRRLDEHEQHCPPAQQWEDALAFLAAGADGGAGPASPPPPRAAQHKRKQPEELVPPVTGSAVKGPRPDGAPGGAAAAAARAAAAPAAAQPASTQHTAGTSTQTQRSSVVVPKQRVIAGRGRGRGRGR